MRGRFLLLGVVPAAVAGFAIVLGAARLTAEPTAHHSLTAQQVALRFIATAVARQHPEQAERLVSADLGLGVSHADWKAGFIPVVPFLARPAHVSVRVLARTRTRMRLLVQMRARHGSGKFLMELERAARGPWLVSYWGPAMFLAAPSSPAR
jgi:hypothetical protein